MSCRSFSRYFDVFQAQAVNDHQRGLGGSARTVVCQESGPSQAITTSGFKSQIGVRLTRQYNMTKTVLVLSLSTARVCCLSRTGPNDLPLQRPYLYPTLLQNRCFTTSRQWCTTSPGHSSQGTWSPNKGTTSHSFEPLMMNGLTTTTAVCLSSAPIKCLQAMPTCCHTPSAAWWESLDYRRTESEWLGLR